MSTGSKPQSAAVIITYPAESIGTGNRLYQFASQLAEQLGLHLTPDNTTDLAQHYHYALQVSPHHEYQYYLALKDLHSSSKAISVNFSEGKLAHRRLFGGGKKQPLARAVGIKPGKTPIIVDTTAGLARDAFVFTCLGCRVILIERSPILGQLIADGLRRARLDPEISQLLQQNMELHIGDASTIMRNSLHCDFDVAYLDPMYPSRSKTALVKKEMRILRDLIGEDMDAPELLNVARNCARQRVVVKRPRSAAPLAGSTPEFKIESKSTRYDIYLSQNRVTSTHPA